ncbi:MAG: hypothetical protein H0T86_02770 [Gemmatimonadales bacterium]|nr:hypothetical protein [Gemmatimonadales bacterium]
MRVIIGGIGYRNLRDHSVGVMVTDILEWREWPDHIAVEDLSYGPIAVVQRFEDDPPERRFDRAIFVAASARGDGRAPGAVTAYRWDGVLPTPERIQGAVGEAVTGVIAIDNTLVVGRYFGALPDEVIVVEVEPEVEAPGEAFGPTVEAAFQSICGLVTKLALDPAAAAELPLAPLGGVRPGAAAR